MLFFTDVRTNASRYCLLNFQRFHDFRVDRKKICLIDPGVYQLTHSDEYRDIRYLHGLARIIDEIEERFWISIDYPPDMNPDFSSLFIYKTTENLWRYRDIKHYVHTPQSVMANWASFKEQNEYNYDFFSSEKIWGVGNLCRLLSPKKYHHFTDRVFHWISRHPKIKKIHVYGAPKWIIHRYLIPLEYKGLKISFDSTKWTKPNKPYSKSCTVLNRDEFFICYANSIPNCIF